MPMLRAKRVSAAAVTAAAVLFGLCAVPAHGVAPERLEIGVQDPMDGSFDERDPAGAFRVLRERNVKFVRVPAVWANVAPSPPGDRTNHRDPGYRWAHLDERIRIARKQGMEPLLYLYAAPRWALNDGAERSPRIGEFQAFATAVSQRYNGTVPGAARVRYWQIWNEPNLAPFLDRRGNVGEYRALVNVAYPRIHAAAPDNVVVAGGLAPFNEPLRFMRDLLCLSRKLKVKPRCRHRLFFDVWSHHPYTGGGPNHRARLRDGVSLGNLGDMVRVLRAGARRSRIQPRRRVPFWVTEFSWDTKPPDPWGVPVQRHARWAAEALYRMWSNGVNLVVWFQLRDTVKGPSWATSWQSGLYFRTTSQYAHEKAKPVADVIAFPFVALPAGRGVLVWGRTPQGGAGAVTVERRRGSRWVRAGSATAGAHGIFRTRLRSGRGGVFRARAGAAASPAFTAVRTRDVRVNPFGGPLQ